MAGCGRESMVGIKERKTDEGKRPKKHLNSPKQIMYEKNRLGTSVDLAKEGKRDKLGQCNDGTGDMVEGNKEEKSTTEGLHRSNHNHEIWESKRRMIETFHSQLTRIYARLAAEADRLG